MEGNQQANKEKQSKKERAERFDSETERVEMFDSEK